jgi:ELWxxDGT repeat protein
VRRRSRLALAVIASAGIVLACATSASAAPSPTDLVADIVAGAGSSDPYSLTPFDGRLYFVADGGTGDELFVSDGSVGSATNLNLNPTGASDPGSLTVIGSTLYFSATNGVDGRELWAITGSGAPAMIADIEPGSGSSNPSGFTLYDGNVYFPAYSSGLGYFLAVLDTSTGVVGSHFMDFESSPGNLLVYNSRLYLSLFGLDGSQLYSLTPASLPQQAAALNTPDDSYPHALAVAGGVLYFLANVSPGGVEYELWAFDGTTATQLTTDLQNQFGYQYFTVFNDTLYFSAGTAATGRELGSTTGGAAPTYFDINPGAGASDPEGFTPYGGSLYFSAYTPASGYELYSITGAAAPVLRADINPGAGQSYPFNFVQSNGKLAFSAASDGNNWQLWSWDGSVANQESAIVSPDADVYEVVALGDYVYFTATSTANGYELWRTRIAGVAAAPTLAATGSDTIIPLGVAALLLLVGAALLRRRSAEELAHI